VATLWSVSDKAALLLMLRFMQVWLQNPALSPARALREAAHWLRTATHEQLDDLAKKGLKGIRSLPEELVRTRDALRGDLESMEEITPVPNDAIRLPLQHAFPLLAHAGYSPAQTSTPFGHAIYWAAAIIYGV
jgi:CHAT domain-containing protein